MYFCARVEILSRQNSCTLDTNLLNGPARVPVTPAAVGDVHAFNSGRGPELNDVGPHQPVRVRVYCGADKATVLTILEKMRAEVEKGWGTNSLE